MKPYIVGSGKRVLLLVSKPDFASAASEQFTPGRLLKKFAEYIRGEVHILPVIHEYCEKETATLINKYRDVVWAYVSQITPVAIVLLGKVAGQSLNIKFSPTKDLGKTFLFNNIKTFLSISPNYLNKSNDYAELKNLFVVGDLVNQYLGSDNSSWYVRLPCEREYDVWSLLNLALKEKVVAFDYETVGLENLTIVSAAFAFDQNKVFSFAVTNERIKEYIRYFLDNFEGTLVAHNAQFEHKVNIVNFGFTRFLDDTRLMINLIDENYPSNLDFVSSYVGITDSWKKDYWSENNLEVTDEFLEYNAKDAAATLIAYHKLIDQVQKKPYNLFCCYSRAVAEMEINGLKIDADGDLLNELENAVKVLEEKVGFSVRSRLALEDYFINKLGVSPPKTEKGNYSFTTASLLASDNPQIQLIGQIKQLYSYIQFIKQYIARRDCDGIVHTSYLQTGTKTGRLASQNPNLQNVPKNILRKFFKSRYDYLVEMDYNQLEPRILATLSRDKELNKIFANNFDLHSYVASLIFHIPYEEFIENLEQYKQKRHIGKQMNLGIMYGLTPIGLAKRTGLTVDEAKRLIKTYFLKFPGVNRFARKCRKQIKELGYVEDLFGRRRHLTYSGDNRVLRQAINFPVTSTGNQCCQMAAYLFCMFNKRKHVKLCANVHDSIILDVRKEDLDYAVALLKRCMLWPNRFLLCKLDVDVKIGENWYEMRKYDSV